MKRFLAILTLLAAFARAETPTPAVDLLAGKSLAAWELVTLPTTPAKIDAVCKFHADGSLAVAGKPVSYLATKAAYKNYRLHAEWRWPADAAKNSNSGVLLHIVGGPTAGTAWPVCFQAQMKLARAGDLLPMQGAKFAEKLSTPPDAKTPQLDRANPTNPEKALGEWNSYDIVCHDGTIEISVNGVLENKVAASNPAEGKIGIQLEGTPFELRNVRIEPLRAIGASYQSPPARDAGPKK
jgi:hypothetical protein